MQGGLFFSAFNSSEYNFDAGFMRDINWHLYIYKFYVFFFSLKILYGSYRYLKTHNVLHIIYSGNKASILPWKNFIAGFYRWSSFPRYLQ